LAALASFFISRLERTVNYAIFRSFQTSHSVLGGEVINHTPDSSSLHRAEAATLPFHLRASFLHIGLFVIAFFLPAACVKEILHEQRPSLTAAFSALKKQLPAHIPACP